MKRGLTKLFSGITTPVHSSKCLQGKKQDRLTRNFPTMYTTFKEASGKGSLEETAIKRSNFIGGYPCYPDYLADYREEFHSELTIKESLLRKARNTLIHLLIQRNYNISLVTLVGVHVRRSDYINYAQKRNLILPSKSFYKNAMDFFKKRYLTFAF